MDWIFQIPLSDIKKERKVKSIQPKNPCICCNNEIKTTKYVVHLLENGNLVSSDQEFQESQGFFPIGVKCKNKLPNNFYFKA